ncbi:2-octaprenylphenol hydroxylase [Paenibacillus cellulosilyticus]|uniref:2-octaprenylphenol hydroxylase n=1 Tax=Paenibacillus cellulosilyticus TaxID=375489 RepID=A0A2V2YZV0_9BACL|nr:AarF/ABC1/UbiB kinase family protein [Paenibacillus cellulosilyticus]PWW07382.1 2-octaprenylphenol hydroxylase [Paenibacillus cellulosilyticus]QKS44450.1 AarF/ABC1/UbiB kinase family protein [Paenibacillus cellulosilyticus]
MIGINRRIRHLQRYRDIAKAFVRNGFGFLVKELGLADRFPISSFRSEEDREHKGKTTGERIRLFLEELGPTFVKFGQIASTRPDLLPADIIAELVKLQDSVPPIPYHEAAAVLEAELGAPVEELFARFDQTPVAAASIGQVHLARLPDGRAVAVKIQRPNIQEQIETDLEILDNLSRIAEHRMEWAANYQLRERISELSQSLRAELDYTIEGRNAERMAKAFERDHSIHIPTIYWDYSSRRVLTMELINGYKITDNEALSELGITPKRIAERITHAMFHQIFEEGLFHADPHPGNLLIEHNGVIGMIDFGMVGRMTPSMKTNFGSLIIAMRRNSTSGIIRAIEALGVLPADIDMRKLRDDIDLLRDKYYDVPLSRVSLGESVSDLFTVAYNHRIRIPSDFMLLGKTLLTLEGVVSSLDPEFSIISVAEPFGRRLFLDRINPRSFAENAFQQVSDYADLLADLPETLRDASSVVRKGKLRTEMSIPELETLLRKIDRVGNRLSFSIVLLSFSIIMVGLIIGSSLGRQSSIIWHFPVIEIGFGIAAFMFLFLLTAIFRSGRF